MLFRSNPGRVWIAPRLSETELVEDSLECRFARTHPSLSPPSEACARTSARTSLRIGRRLVGPWSDARACGAFQVERPTRQASLAQDIAVSSWLMMPRAYLPHSLWRKRSNVSAFPSSLIERTIAYGVADSRHT